MLNKSYLPFEFCATAGATDRERLIYETIIVQLTARRAKSQIIKCFLFLCFKHSVTVSAVTIGHRGNSQKGWQNLLKRSFFFFLHWFENREKSGAWKVCETWWWCNNNVLHSGTFNFFHLGTSMLLKWIASERKQFVTTLFHSFKRNISRYKISLKSLFARKVIEIKTWRKKT